jgi:hypothetical protein
MVLDSMMAPASLSFHVVLSTLHVKFYISHLHIYTTFNLPRPIAPHHLYLVFSHQKSSVLGIHTSCFSTHVVATLL